jgi:hypothetical protein
MIARTIKEIMRELLISFKEGDLIPGVDEI